MISAIFNFNYTGMELTFRQKLFYFFPVLFCFCMPFGPKRLPWLIALWILVSFFNLSRQKLKAGLKNNNLHLLYLFFVLTALSALVSVDRKEAWFSVEVKLAFLFFPYLLFCFEWPVAILKRCVVSFVSGCFFACIYLIVRAFYYSVNGQPEYFFYTLFSDLIHASYFSMYLVMCIIIVVLFYNKWFRAQKSVLISSYFFVAVFIIAIFLCSSKLGIISFFICVPLLFLYKWKCWLNAKKIMLIVAGLVISVLVAVKLFPDSFGRLSSLSSVTSHIDKTSSESTAVRILIWQEAAKLIKANFLFGTGVGDVNDELYSAYKQQGMTGALDHRLNAHNQFFQTFIGLGILGMTLLLLITFGQLVKAILKKHFLLFIFSLVITLNFLVESMLQTSAGVLFFTFFFCLYNLVDEKKLMSD